MLSGAFIRIMAPGGVGCQCLRVLRAAENMSSTRAKVRIVQQQ